MTSTDSTADSPQRRGFGIDVGGSGIKGGIVDLDSGQLIGDRIKLLTPQPASPSAVAKTIAEVVEDPHIAARNMIVNVPVAGKLIGMFGLPIKLSGREEAPNESAPAPGEHTAALLRR